MKLIQEKTKKGCHGTEGGHINNFVYIDKTPYIKQKRKTFQEWKVRFEYDEDEDEEEEDVASYDNDVHSVSATISSD